MSSRAERRRCRRVCKSESVLCLYLPLKSVLMIQGHPVYGRRQHEQLSQFERRIIIGIVAGGVARQLGCFICAVRIRWDQWIREISFTRRPDPGRLRKTSR
ncbi:hypothetical protein TNCV_399821 [Trichonephila clavipes]|nr:hypothetical protein TNCV_399821 [Trichonephila clavipes]